MLHGFPELPYVIFKMSKPNVFKSLMVLVEVENF